MAAAATILGLFTTTRGFFDWFSSSSSADDDNGMPPLSVDAAQLAKLRALKARYHRDASAYNFGLSGNAADVSDNAAAAGGVVLRFADKVQALAAPSSVRRHHLDPRGLCHVCLDCPPAAAAAAAAAATDCEMRCQCDECCCAAQN
jgi:hypothetical protein